MVSVLMIITTILLLRLLMLFRTMTDGVGLDDYYNNIVVDVVDVV